MSKKNQQIKPNCPRCRQGNLVVTEANTAKLECTKCKARFTIRK